MSNSQRLMRFQTWNVNGKNVNGRLSYSPTLEHAQNFAIYTGDENPIHKEHPKYNGAIVPGFLHAMTSMGLFQEAARRVYGNEHSYNYRTCDVQMKGPIVSGKDYTLTVDFSGDTDTTFAKIIDGDGKGMFTLEQHAFDPEPENFFPSTEGFKLAYKGKFIGDKVLDFSDIINETLADSVHLYALAGSSSAVTDAVKTGSLRPLPEGVVALYDSQRLYLDSSFSLNPVAGISTELYFSDISKFGELMKKGETLDMLVVGRDIDGRQVYASQSPLSFQKSKLIDLVLRKASK